LHQKAKYTSTQENEIVALLQQNAKANRTEIAEMFGLPPASVQFIAKKHGYVQSKHGGVKPTVLLKSLDEEIEELKRKLEEAKSKRERLSIRFDLTGHEISVYGILDTEEPFTASIAGWLRFLNNEGPAKLREFIQGVNQNGGRK
jgi:hypothetical protein